MSVIVDFHSHALDQEPDTIALIPQHPDYMIVGTYHLNKPDEHDQDHDKSTLPLRGGSLQILPFSIGPQQTDPIKPIAQKNFSCAIIDLHFHPEDETLLGAATSTGQVRLFRVCRDEKSSSQDVTFRIAEIGSITVSETENPDPAPLITLFNWVPDTRPEKHTEPPASPVVTLVACDTKGDIKLVRVTMKTTASLVDRERPQNTEGGISTSLSHQIETIHQHQHGLEAWYVTHIQLQKSDQDNTNTPYLILSGGDDACLHASTCTISNPQDTSPPYPPTKQFTLKKQHESGVVSITPLPKMASGIIPILTGSYDDHLRLFTLDPTILPRPPTQTASINLEGGVWRATLLDQYTIAADINTTNSNSNSNSDMNVPTAQTEHWILLISTMYDGAKIIRLTWRSGAATSRNDPNSALQTWQFTVEAVFKAGHQSMVYAAIGRVAEHRGLWDIVSTSFYDRKVCRWQWRDELKNGLASTE